MDKDVIIGEEAVDNIDAVREFYKEVDYDAYIDPKCRMITARRDGKIIGIARVCLEDSTRMLRGVEVVPEFQRKGIGSGILAAASDIMKDEKCFVLPYGHLEHFYGRIGFKKIQEGDAPIFLQERIAGYRKEMPDKTFIIMKR